MQQKHFCFMVMGDLTTMVEKLLHGVLLIY